MTTEAKSWAEIIQWYQDVTQENPFWQTLLSLVYKLAESEYKNIFFPLNTMQGLLLSQTKIIRLNQQNLLIKPGEKFTIEYQDTEVVAERWVRTCAPEDAFTLIESFVKDLHLLSKNPEQI